jgi:hypothetical protein
MAEHLPFKPHTAKKKKKKKPKNQVYGRMCMDYMLLPAFAGFGI